jgi:hypothetical protein
LSECGNKTIPKMVRANTFVKAVQTRSLWNKFHLSLRYASGIPSTQFGFFIISHPAFVQGRSCAHTHTLSKNNKIDAPKILVPYAVAPPGHHVKLLVLLGVSLYPIVVCTQLFH